MPQLEDWDITTSVGFTALGVAATRAMESQREDSLVDDPFAAHFVARANAGVPLPTGPDDLGFVGDDTQMRALWTTMTDYMAVRSRYFDDYMNRSAASGIRQVVILASGLDTRGYRLDWPDDVDLYEIDQPKVLEFKAEVLAEQGAEPRCRRRAIGIDLREDWGAELVAAGFDRTRPTAWLAEGLLPYLPEEAVLQLFDSVHYLSAPGSRISVEDIDEHVRDMFDDQLFADAQREFGIDIRSLWPEGKRPDVVGWLCRHGWEVSAAGGQQVAAHLGRALDSEIARFFGGAKLLTADLG